MHQQTIFGRDTTPDCVVVGPLQIETHQLAEFLVHFTHLQLFENVLMFILRRDPVISQLLLLILAFLLLHHVLLSDGAVIRINSYLGHSSIPLIFLQLLRLVLILLPGGCDGGFGLNSHCLPHIVLLMTRESDSKRVLLR